MRTRGRGYKGPCGRPQACIFLNYYHVYNNFTLRSVVCSSACCVLKSCVKFSSTSHFYFYLKPVADEGGDCPNRLPKRVTKKICISIFRILNCRIIIWFDYYYACKATDCSFNIISWHTSFSWSAPWQCRQFTVSQLWSLASVNTACWSNNRASMQFMFTYKAGISIRVVFPSTHCVQPEKNASIS